MSNATLLIADDDHNVIVGLRYLLKNQGYELVTASSPAEVRDAVKRLPIDLVLMDMNFQRDTTSGSEGLSLIDSLRELDAQLPIVVMTGWATVDLAVQALKAGARDLVQKPWDDERLLGALATQLRTVRAERQAARLGRENQLLRDSSSEREGLIAESPAMRALLDQLETLAASEMNVLLSGENGSGKSLLAQHLHRVSARRERSFIAVNMGAIPESLFESELFGHKKGAFTDAREDRIGRIELADGGTLFLDELANIPLSQQAKLLRVLEERQYERVGSSKTLRADIRLVSATNADLAELIEQGAFRRDLYYRLNTVELRVPALRERREDILPLAQYFLAQHAQRYRRPQPSITDAAATRLQAQPWPGNIRELNHTMERLLFTAGEQIKLSDLAPAASGAAASGALDDPSLTLEQIERQVLQQRLQHFDGNASETARSLGLSRSGYYRRLAKHAL